MRLPTGLLKIGIGVSLALCLPAQADGYDCTQLMYEHGLATSAQINCGYESYNNAVIDKVAQCMTLAEKHGQAERLAGVLKEGIADFTSQYNSVDNKPAICQAFADNFPLFVKP